MFDKALFDMIVIAFFSFLTHATLSVLDVFDLYLK